MERVELRAIDLAKRYFERLGYMVEDVSRIRGHNGYDFLLKRGDETKKVEVKGATRRWGIPDPYHTEFDENLRLVADILCVVYFIEKEPPRICLIPREAIRPEHVVARTGYRIKGGFKNQKTLEPFLVPFVDGEDG